MSVNFKVKRLLKNVETGKTGCQTGWIPLSDISSIFKYDKSEDDEVKHIKEDLTSIGLYNESMRYVIIGNYKDVKAQYDEALRNNSLGISSNNHIY